MFSKKHLASNFHKTNGIHVYIYFEEKCGFQSDINIYFEEKCGFQSDITENHSLNVMNV
jgi:hypothetical protein